MKSLILFIYALFISSNVFSQPSNQTPPQKIANIFYINGIGKSSLNQVDGDLTAIRNSMASFCPQFNGQIQLLFNKSNGEGVSGLLQDVFIDLALQKRAELLLPFASAFSAIVTSFYGFSGFLSPAEIESIRNRANANFNRSLISFDSAQKQRDFLGIVSPSITQSRSALIIAHSQGNLYANGIQTELMASGNRFFQGGFHIVNVATPSAFAPYGNYYTAIQDAIINGYRDLSSTFLVLPALPGNVNLNGFSRFDISGHNFKSVYFSNELPLGSSGRTSSAGMLITVNVNQGFREIYRRVDANGRQVVADSSSNSPCDR